MTIDDIDENDITYKEIEEYKSTDNYVYIKCKDEVFYKGQSIGKFIDKPGILNGVKDTTINNCRDLKIEIIKNEILGQIKNKELLP